MHANAEVKTKSGPFLGFVCIFSNKHRSDPVGYKADVASPVIQATEISGVEGAAEPH